MLKSAVGQARPLARGSTIKGVILVLAQALPIMAVVSLFPVIPKLAAQFGSASNAAYLVPMIITLPSLGIAIFSPAAGWLTDRFGRRPVFIASLALYAVAGLAPLWLTHIRPIVVSRAILGVAEAGVVTVASTLIADYFGDNRHRWLAIQSALGSVLGTLLIALGGWLAEFSWRGPFSVYVAAIPLFLLALVFIDEPIIAVRVEPLQTRSKFPLALALLIGLVSLVASALYYVEPTQIALLFSERGVQSSSQIGLLQAATSIAYIAGAYLYKRVSGRTVAFQLAIAGGTHRDRHDRYRFVWHLPAGRVLGTASTVGGRDGHSDVNRLGSRQHGLRPTRSCHGCLGDIFFLRIVFVSDYREFELPRPWADSLLRFGCWA